MRWVKKTESAGNGQARWREAGSPSRRRRLEGNETTAFGQDEGVWQDVGGGDAAGRTPARPGETGSQDDDEAALGQKYPSTGETIYTMYPLHDNAPQSSHSDETLAHMGIVKVEEGADKMPADTRKGRSGAKAQAACGPRKGDAGRASTSRIQVFPPYDRRSKFCWNADRREALAFYGVNCQMWPPMLPCSFPEPQNWTKEIRRKYNSERGISPVYTVPGGGPLWLGNMNAARNTRLLKGNWIWVRMSCLGGSSRKGKGWDDWGGATASEDVRDLRVLDVNGILSGHVPMSHLWYILREVDYLLESGHNVLIYCAHGARRSAFVASCYLKSQIPMPRL